MQVRVITMKYQEGLQAFPEDLLQKVTFGRTVLDVSEHFFVHGNVPHLTLVLKLADVPTYENGGSYRPHDPNAPDPEEGMTDVQKAAYRDLKTWRNEISKTEGRPAYAIARNIQLAEIVKSMPQTKSALKEIRGIGEGFCEKYGDKVMAEEGSSSGSNRVKRGGSWNNNANNCTSSNRNNNNPSNENNNNGFRLVSTRSGQTGSHSVRPALRECGDEHARQRPVSSVCEHRVGAINDLEVKI